MFTFSRISSCGDARVFMAVCATMSTNREGPCCYELLQWGGDPNLVDAFGLDALMYAARNGRLPAAEILLQGGADVTHARMRAHTVVQARGGDLAPGCRRRRECSLGRQTCGAPPTATLSSS